MATNPRRLVLALPLLLAACSAHMVGTHGDKVQLFKTGREKAGRGGVIRYLANGPSVFKRARRADAEKQMKSFCRGEYDVTAEGPRSKFGSAMPVGDKVSVEFDEYWYVAFECEAAAEPALTDKLFR